MVNKKIFVQQTNQSWCGLACLSMITKYYGGEISQEKLVNISGTNVSGTTLLGLYQAATVIGLQAEGMEGNIDDLAKLVHPAILHFTLADGLQHYVIYFGINNGKYIIADPAIGFEEIDVQVLKEKWKSKTLLSVKKTDKFKETSAVNKEKQNWLKSLLKPDIQILSVVLVFSVVFSALGITLALFSQKLVDDILPSKEITRLITGIIIITLLLLVKNGIGYIRTKLSARQLRDFSNRIISQYYNIVLFLPKFFFDSLKTGEITARLNDAARIQHTISYAVGAFIIDIFTIVIVSVLLFLYWWPVGIIVIMGSLFFTWIFLKNAKKILNAQKQVMTNYAQSESFFFDSVQGAGVIKAFGREQYFSQMGLNIYNLFQHAIFDLTLLNTRIGLWAQNIAVAVIVIVIAIGSNAVMNDVLSLGALMAVITFCSTLLTSVSSLMGAYFAYQEAKVAYNRLYEFAGMEKENHKEKITFTSVKELSLRNVSFRYTGRPLVFKNLSFTATIGAVNVIAGDVGCGKTTLLNLLIRFYKPETGEITVDSVNIEETTLQQWRISTGIMYQSTKLFNATLVENICLSNEEQALRQAMTLCDNLKITTYFNALPLGFLTRIGEDGINLSGGQLQLVGLCRALYNNPAILLLDEPTNNMDEKTKALFWEIISVEKSKRICIVVSHEKEMISRADNIIAL